MIENDGKGTSLDRLHKGNLTEEVTSELNIVSAGEKKAEGRAFQAGETSRPKTLPRVQAAWCTQGQKESQCTRTLQAPAGWSTVRGQAEARSWRGFQNMTKGLDFILSAMERF